MQTRTLDSLIEEYGGIIQTGPFGSQLHQAEYTEVGIPVVMPKDIVDGRVNESTTAKISEQKAMELSQHLLQAGDIVFPRRGDIGKRALIDESSEGFFCGTGCLKIRLSREAYSTSFLYYYLGLRQAIEWLERNAVGTTMLNLSAKIVGNLKVPIVNLPTQEHIVKILSAYDDLIENNRRRIQLLEQAAQLIYKEWFVHLRFPGHEHTHITNGVPKGWERKKIGKISSFQYGKSLKRENRIPGRYPVYGSSGIVGTHEKALVTGPAIIVGRKGNVGTVYWSDADFWPIDTVYYTDAQHCTVYLYYALLHTRFTNTDVAVPGLNREFAHSRELLIPEPKILKFFEKNTVALRKQLTCLTQYNRILSKARDLLLSRLMNGEIACQAHSLNKKRPDKNTRE